ncbi:hypothetical protein MNVM_02090 [Mycobacterium novum]|uniref:Uncharacterized protein n=1 Tax=Mycobacterium novum TaxID=2492438 RepID=A0A7I7JI20_9MYCO|nr:hypothetical protein [Mycobacterium novum]BBX11128.1 hypothetical protein MNVM_02090 [Mycobacterium novum]
MTPEAQAEIDGIHAALTAATAYHDGNMGALQAILTMHRTDALPLVFGLLGAFDSLLRSVPGEPHEILQILRNVVLRTEAGGGR